MTVINCQPIPRLYHNVGQHLEQTLTYNLTGKIRKHDCVPFDKGADIPEYGISVKSARATLVSGMLMNASTREGQITEYFQRVRANGFAYVTKDETAYIMDASEFYKFLMRFTSFEKDSTKNGGRYKVRIKSETREMLAWLGAL